MLCPLCQLLTQVLAVTTTVIGDQTATGNMDNSYLSVQKTHTQPTFHSVHRTIYYRKWQQVLWVSVHHLQKCLRVSLDHGICVPAQYELTRIHSQVLSSG